MLFSSEYFRAYDTILLGDSFDYENFKPGLYGLKLGEFRQATGAGANAIVSLANIFNITDDVEVLKFSLDKNCEVKYVLSPSFKLDKNEAGENTLYFIMGDWRLDLASVFESVEAANCSIEEAICKVVKSDNTETLFAGFKFNLNVLKPSEKDPSKMIRAKNPDNEFEFIISYSSDFDNAREELVKIFKSGDGELSDIIDALLVSPYVGKVGEAFTFAKLKELPLGAYTVSNIEWEDKEVIEKATGKPTRIQSWKFKAVSLVDKQVYLVNAAPTSFIGRKITNTGNNESPLLNQAGKGKNGSVLMTVEALEPSGKGVSVKGMIPAAQAYVNMKLPQLLAKELQAANNAPQLKSAAPELAPAF